MKKKLYKNKENKIFCGIIGGLGDYLNIDPTILRLIWLLVIVFTGFFPGLFIYIIACFIIPDKLGK
ncbi:MAG TPA: PspC domain-containing protein [Candidatus Pacearchaeota archaeon]|nr:PspC domain-containing protein [Candidatus Pacearchaeota archaeon]